MKIVFVGPSLPNAKIDFDGKLEIRPPAKQGDIFWAVDQGATTICLIDGNFEYTAPVWHKEILFALSKGINVIGAASMGALRAVECEPFGMVGCGQIFSDYSTGRRIDDGDVALLHGPAELGYPALTIPLVNLDATLDRLSAEGQIARPEAEHLVAVARSINFRERTFQTVLQTAGLDNDRYLALLKNSYFDLKRSDAVFAIETTIGMAENGIIPTTWSFNETPLWRKLYGEDRSALVTL